MCSLGLRWGDSGRHHGHGHGHGRTFDMQNLHRRAHHKHHLTCNEAAAPACRKQALPPHTASRQPHAAPLSLPHAPTAARGICTCMHYARCTDDGMDGTLITLCCVLGRLASCRTQTPEIEPGAMRRARAPTDSRAEGALGRSMRPRARTLRCLQPGTGPRRCTITSSTLLVRPLTQSSCAPSRPARTARWPGGPTPQELPCVWGGGGDALRA